MPGFAWFIILKGGSVLPVGLPIQHVGLSLLGALNEYGKSMHII